MSKKTFVLFGIFAALFVVAIPVWAINKEGSEGASPEKVAASDQNAKQLFQTNCGSCHTLARAGTDGIVGPDLDDLLGGGTPEANKQRVTNAIDNGISGRMPAKILQGQDEQTVADFVSRVAGQ
jgi:mono/diheme cytochrome c family protein